MTDNSENLISKITDLSSFAMASGCKDKIAYFDLFFRSVPDNGGFVIMAGVEQLVESLKTLSFSQKDIAILKSSGIDDGYLKTLENFKFRCDVWAVPEGTPVFPNEPIVTVRGPYEQALLIESIILMSINYPSLIATKANRISRAVSGRRFVDVGSRRAHSHEAAVLGARAAFIGGSDASSCACAVSLYNIPQYSTMNHAFVQMFDSEIEAFRAYARQKPQDCTLLVDTYSTLKSGIPNAIEIFKDEVLPRGFRPKSIRIDSGDITYLSIKARKMLDDAGFSDCEVIASNSLDEYIIRDMLLQGARVDTFCVGDDLISPSGTSVLNGVYKLCAAEHDGIIEPKIKISGNVSKITTPCFKNVYRLFDRESGKAIADLLTVDGEIIDENKEYELFDPDFVWKRKTVSNFLARPLMTKLFDNGKCIYTSRNIYDIKAYCKDQTDSLWGEVMRFENPHKYYVDLSQKLWDEKSRMLNMFK